MTNPNITGQLFFRDATARDENGLSGFKTKDGRKLMMVCGVIAVPEETVIKPEHQHVVIGNAGTPSGDSGYLTIMPHAIDRTEMARGNSIDGLLTQAIWRH